jgi:hypothetical protein
MFTRNGSSTGGELLALPRNRVELDEAIRRSRSLVTRRAAIASVASLAPLPGLDIAVDIAAVMKMIPEINREFGLTPEQIDSSALAANCWSTSRS